MSGAAYDLFHVKEVFCRAPWDAEAVGQHENNIETVPRAVLSSAPQPRHYLEPLVKCKHLLNF